MYDIRGNFSPMCGRNDTIAHGGANLGDMAAENEIAAVRPSAVYGSTRTVAPAAFACRRYRGCEISHLVSAHFASIWIRELSIGDDHGDLPECGVDPHAAVSILGRPTSTPEESR
jgi:hypothetical protein